MTTVVHVRDCPPGWERDPRYVYCGRAGRGLDGPWGNRHRVGPCDVCGRAHDRDGAVDAHRDEVSARYASDPEYRLAVESLCGKFLVCFCAPRRCHCDNYAGLLAGRAVAGVARG